MEKKLAIEIMKWYNSWRRWEIEDYIYEPKEIGIAIDVLIKIAEDDNNKEIKG